MKPNTFIEGANNWIKNSVTLKLTGITILVLLLLIPSSMIDSIIYERKMLSEDAIHEVSSKWSNDQTINGPILTLPLLFEYKKEDELVQTMKYYHILPNQLDIKSDVEPEKLHRGIYEVVVYKSDISIRGKFDFQEKIVFENLKAVKWEDAFLTLGISDLRGIEEQIDFKWKDQKLTAQSGSKISNLISSGVTFSLPIPKSGEEISQNFQVDLKLQGSGSLNFIPTANTTNVNIASVWDSPSFNGNFLPDDREVSENGFKANWKVLQLNRNYPQNWLGSTHASSMHQSAFGVDLILPLDDYQKAIRSSKYAVMTIVLTFLIFFLVEIMNKKRIHPFQYTLVGLSLCLFYVLLISISEHSSFNLAYGLSSLASVTMISLYSIPVFKSKKLSLLLVGTLIGIYGFLFATLQMVDFALLMGSIGLTIILAGTMYFTRNINWYQLHPKTN